MLYRYGENNPSWKGGFKKNYKGYVLILKRGYPNTDSSGYIFYHRYLMEQKLGRPLTKNEDIHHINGIKDDNRIENLELLDHSFHSKISNIKDMSNRFCSKCESKDTGFDKSSGCFHWYKNKIDGGFLCSSCYRKNKKINLIQI